MFAVRHLHRLESVWLRPPRICMVHRPVSPIYQQQLMKFSDQKLSLKERYENYLKTNYPRIYTIHMRILEGTKSCYTEIKTYFKIRKDLYSNTRQLSNLSREELEVLIQCPPEILYLIFIIVLIQIPIIGDAIIVGMIFFPRIVMTRHFWTDEQRRTFWLKNIAKSQSFYFKTIVDQLPGKPQLPVPYSQVSTVEVFPLNKMPTFSMLSLARVHQCWSPFGLEKRALYLRTLDDLMRKNINIIDSFTEQQLFMHLYIRRINYSNLSSEQMRSALKDWIRNSPAFSKNSSIYLHVPIITQYNSNKQF